MREVVAGCLQGSGFFEGLGRALVCVLVKRLAVKEPDRPLHAEVTSHVGVNGPPFDCPFRRTLHAPPRPDPSRPRPDTRMLLVSSPLSSVKTTDRARMGHPSPAAHAIRNNSPGRTARRSARCCARWFNILRWGQEFQVPYS
jgi:hypothetical protein